MEFYMQLTITRKTAEQILTERGSSIDRLKQFGRFDIGPEVFLTVVGGRRFTLIDLSPDAGDRIADLVPFWDRRLLPCCEPDPDGTTREQRQQQAQEQARLDRLRILLQAPGHRRHQACTATIA